ncbi:D-glycerate dehydrogenase [Kocuria sp. WRN011]|uniref:2-hydroxyacid dehydrogenase n=1 Tax=Kocuria sp. WRN011 TaxID=2029858 RepID=UPI000BAF185A|nr:D-glycerate dehydrogenase [Kocuria sp. WRN011]PBB09121.1 D-glycerate dehydrogenase [Kocuria sp. WRN011]PZP35410.1 MAG: D-glycerate dehydrogenase [Kocuria rhizophila]
MSTPRFLVTREIPEPGPSILKEAGDVVIKDGVSADELREAVTSGEYDVVLPQVSDKFDAELLSQAKIRGIANYAVGYNNIDVPAAAENGIAVGNTPDVLNDATANTAMLLLLGAARRAHEASEYLREGRFTGIGPNLLVGQDITGATLGIAGMGRIGKAVAQRALGFGMKVIFTQRPPHDRPVSDDELGDLAGRVTQVPWDELVETSDFISLHVPLTEETTHLIDRKVLRRMKSTAVLVNTARGPVVDENALVRALRDREIFAAGLDVYENEPEMADGLVELPNAFLLPHVGSAEGGSRAGMARKAAENAVAMARGETPPYEVKP